MTGFALSEEQLAAATSERDHLLIVAPPGCGKTEVLAHRAAHQIGSLQPNQKVLALTFTKRARANLEERLRSATGQARARRQIVVRNFHGFATQIVLAHGRTIGLRMDGLEMPKTSTMRRAMEAAGGGQTMYDAERLLAETKRNPLSDVEVLEAIEQQEQSPAVLLAAKVERARQEANQLHYDDLLRHAQRLLHVPAVAKLYQAHFGAVLVDEFQDLSLQQLDIAVLSCSDRRTFAGDPLQGIYSWAGAMPAEVEAEVRSTCGDPIRLRESYRSSPKVLEMVNSISEQVDPGSGLVSALPEKWPGGGCSAALVLQDQAAEAALAVRLAMSIHAAAPEASIGIIARAGWRRKPIDAAFANQTDIPVRTWELAIDDPATVTLIQSTPVDRFRASAGCYGRRRQAGRPQPPRPRRRRRQRTRQRRVRHSRAERSHHRPGRRQVHQNCRPQAGSGPWSPPAQRPYRQRSAVRLDPCSRSRRGAPAGEAKQPR